MKLRHPALALLLVATLCVSGLPSATASRSSVQATRGASTIKPLRQPPTGASAVADNRLLVRLKGRVTADKLARIYRSAETSAGAIGTMRGGLLLWRVPKGHSRADFAARLKGTGHVAYAVPNYVRQLAGYTPPAFAAPNDPAYLDTQDWGYPNGVGGWLESYSDAKGWWIRDVSGVPAWQKGYTGPDISGKHPLRSGGDGFKVGVVDTGVYLSHADRSSFMVTGSVDYAPVDPSLGPYSNFDDNVTEVSHGTCVAGIVGAAVNNSEGTLGIANDTQVAMYKVYFGGPGIDDADLISAVYQATDDGCKVINMSIAGGPSSQPLQDAIDYAWGHGSVIVAASGNDGASTVSNPAAMNHVVAVGALAHNGSGQRIRASYSNFGSQLDISAPGSWIWGLTKPGYTDPNGGEPGYRWWDGTSMASPLVAGSIAWLWRAAPWMTNSQVIALVQSTATDMGVTGRDNVYGYGDINLDRAYSRIISDYPLLQKPILSVPSGDNARNVRIAWPPVSGFGVTYAVAVDGVQLTASTTATTVTLPYDTSTSEHVVTVTPRSPRNWADGSEPASITVHPTSAYPEVRSLKYYRGKLLWNDTEASHPHTDTVSIDGGTARVVSGESWATSSLTYGSHSASLTVWDQGGTNSQPATLTFTVRPKPTVSRTTASSRYSYATALSRTSFTAAKTAVLVSSGSWVDALSAAPLAHVVRGPVLLTSRNSLPSTTKSELARLGVKKIIIVGDASHVSASLKRSLAKRYRVVRIAGSDRYTTANAVARSIAARSGWTVANRKVVVVGGNYASALTASAVAARKGWPLLYTSSASVRKSTRDTIKAIHATSALVVGSTAAVSNTAKGQLPSATRISSTNSLSIPTLLADWATKNYPAAFSGERIYVASNSQWGGSLGLPAASAERGGLVLETTWALAAPVKSYYTARSEIAVTTRVVGSSTSIANSAVNTIKSIVGAP